MKLDHICCIDHRRGFPQAASVPDKPGIYAWYFDFQQMEKLVTTSARFTKYLEEVLEALRYPELSGEMAGNWSEKFSGALTHSIHFPKRVRTQLLGNATTRRHFVQILSSFSPLANPLYIGITKKQHLRDRYVEHIDAYRQAAAGATNVKNVFGTRLHERALSPEQLIFACMPLPKNSVTDVELAESVLNRLFRPIFGRR